MAATTTTEIPSAVSEFYDRNLLERAVEENLHDQFAQVRPMKSRMGKTIKFRRYNSLDGSTPASFALTEGTTPAGEQLSKTDVSATLTQHGNFVTITDVVDYTNPDSILTEAGQILGEQMGEVRDILVRDIVVAGTSVIYENGTQNGAARANVSAAAELDGIKLAVQTLRTGNAKPIKKVIRASVGINTYPISPSYCAITHNLSANTYRGITGFVEWHEYAKPDEMIKNEVGQVWDVRVSWTNNAKVWAGAGSGAIDVYSTTIFGQNAYGVTPFEKGTARNIVKQLGSGGSSDPLDQRATSGWKLMMTAAILQNAYMLRYEHAAN